MAHLTIQGVFRPLVSAHHFPLGLFVIIVITSDVNGCSHAITLNTAGNTMLSVRRLTLLICVVLVVCLGCSNKEAKLRDDLKAFGLAYTTYDVENNKTSASWDELIAFAKTKPELSADSIQRVRDAGYEVMWGVEEGPQGPAETVLAKPPGDGPQVMMNGRVPE